MAWSRIAYRSFGHKDRDSPVRLVITRYISWPNLRLLRDSKNQTNHSGRDSSVLERRRTGGVGSHPDIVLLAWRSKTIPNHSPSAARGQAGTEVADLHRKHQLLGAIQ